jgi:hypothetical protein
MRWVKWRDPTYNEPVEKIIGRDVVEARGGKVISVGYIEDGVHREDSGRPGQPVRLNPFTRSNSNRPPASTRPAADHEVLYVIFIYDIFVLQEFLPESCVQSISSSCAYYM